MSDDINLVVHRLLETVLDLDGVVPLKNKNISDIPGKQKAVKDFKSSIYEGLDINVDKEQYLTVDSIDVFMIERIIESDTTWYAQLPFHYLLACIQRLQDCRDKLDGKVEQQLSEKLSECRKMLINYAFTALTDDQDVMQPQWAIERGPARLLLDSIQNDQESFARECSGFVLEPLNIHILEEIAMVADASKEAAFVEVLGSAAYQLTQIQNGRSLESMDVKVFKYINQLLGSKAVSRLIVKSKYWLAKQPVRGIWSTMPARLIVHHSILGPLFQLAATVDPLYRKSSELQAQYFLQMYSKKRPKKILMDDMQFLRTKQMSVVTNLHELSQKLLKNRDTREAMLTWFAEVLKRNAVRARMQHDMYNSSPSSFFLVLCHVLLKLCEPFLDPSTGLAFDRIDYRYLLVGHRIKLGDETRIVATTSEAQEAEKTARVELGIDPPDAGVVSDSAQPSSSSGQGKYEPKFICEAFFLTAQALHLGMVGAINDQQMLMNQMSEAQQVLKMLEAEAQAGEVERRAQINEQIKRMDDLQQAHHLMEVQLGDVELRNLVQHYYRLMACWLIKMAIGNTQIANLQLPITSPPPVPYAVLPEYFVEDLANVIMYSYRMQQLVLAAPSRDTPSRDHFTHLACILMGTPSYLRNPYLRGRLAEMLHMWRPQSDAMKQGRSKWTDHDNVFEGDHLLLKGLVPSLIRLFVDIEYTDRNNQFYEKFYMRSYISEMLEHLWKLPTHRPIWRKVARDDSGDSLYLRFANMLVNDITYLLDEALNKLVEVKELENLKDDRPKWDALDRRSREEKERALRHAGSQARNYLHLARVFVRNMDLSTQQEDVCRVFLRPEMVERMGQMLNYFLVLLVGHKRNQLKVKNSEMYNFNPKELLISIMGIYLCMHDNDTQGVFAKAIVADQRSYKLTLFKDAQKLVVSKNMMRSKQQEMLGYLIRQLEKAEEEENFDKLVDQWGDIAPDEFRDPIYYHIMRDPVMMPTSRTYIDRKTIQIHLLSDQRDPFVREHLTADQLVEAPELKARIDVWLREQERLHKEKVAGAAESGDGEGLRPSESMHSSERMEIEEEEADVDVDCMAGDGVDGEVPGDTNAETEKVIDDS